VAITLKELVTELIRYFVSGRLQNTWDRETPSVEHDSDPHAITR
jgi:hypothetical protein